MFDPSNLPITGGVTVPVVLYALASVFITGPLVGERTIEKSGWAETCPRSVAQGVERARPVEPVVPKLDCDALFGSRFGEEGGAWCRRYGDSLQLPFTSMLDAPQRAAREVHEQRLAYAAVQADTRCACAVTTTLEERRLAFGLYAGSLRLVTPPAVRNLSSELHATLGSPQCLMKE